MAVRPGRLCLADGTTFEGTLFGAMSTATGEVVFTTGMTGYQEILTDPSYAGQLVTMTAPEIGNTGINAEDHENRHGKAWAAGLIVRRASSSPSNWRSEESLDAYLVRQGTAGLSDVDTRKLTRHLRDHGSQNGAVGDLPRDELCALAKQAPAMEGLDLVARVTPAESYEWTEGSGTWRREVNEPTSRPHVVALDFGIKANILRRLVDVGCRVTAVPATTTAEEVLGMAPDGIFLSNGPGDPAAVGYAVETVSALLGKKPLFGICLGHQLLCRAIGARTYKLKFGHRGINQPVKDLTTGRVEITSQNHGFAVEIESLPKEAHNTHLHLNDGTSEGIDLPTSSAFSVQYHPEAAAGPHDADYLFARFVAAIEHAGR